MRGELAPVAFDWLEVIVVRSGTASLRHRDDGRRQHVRSGDVVVLLPNVPCGDSREQAAKMLGGPSHNTLERVLAVKQFAADPDRGGGLRAEAGKVLSRIEAGEPVDPLFRQVRRLCAAEDLERVSRDGAEPAGARDAAALGAAMIRRMDADAQLSSEEMDRLVETVRDQVLAARLPDQNGFGFHDSKVRGPPRTVRNPPQTPG
jgi:hypothetical protein